MLWCHLVVNDLSRHLFIQTSHGPWFGPLQDVFAIFCCQGCLWDRPKTWPRDSTFVTRGGQVLHDQMQNETVVLALQSPSSQNCCVVWTYQQNDHSRATGVETALLLGWTYLLQTFLVCSVPATMLFYLCPSNAGTSNCASGSFTVATWAVRNDEAFFMCFVFVCRTLWNIQDILDCCWQHLEVALKCIELCLLRGLIRSQRLPDCCDIHHTVYFKLLLTALARSIFDALAWICSGDWTKTRGFRAKLHGRVLCMARYLYL